MSQSPFLSATPPRPTGPAATEAADLRISGGTRGTPPPSLAARPASLLMAHQDRWGIEGGQLRPIPAVFRLVAGIQGVEDDGRGGVKVGTAILGLGENGWAIIPPETLPPSQAHRRQYIGRLVGRPDVHLFYWQMAFPGSDQLRRDDALYYEWLDYAVSSGAVPPCPDYVAERLLDRATDEHSHAIDRAKVTPSAVPIAERLATEIEILTAEVERRRAAARPAEPAEQEAAEIRVDLPARRGKA